MMIPNIWNNKKCSKPPTSQVFHVGNASCIHMTCDMGSNNWKRTITARSSLHWVAAVRSKRPALRNEENHLKGNDHGPTWTCWETNE